MVLRKAANDPNAVLLIIERLETQNSYGTGRSHSKPAIKHGRRREMATKMRKVRTAGMLSNKTAQ